MIDKNEITRQLQNGGYSHAYKPLNRQFFRKKFGKLPEISYFCIRKYTILISYQYKRCLILQKCKVVVWKTILIIRHQNW